MAQSSNTLLVIASVSAFSIFGNIFRIFFSLLLLVRPTIPPFYNDLSMSSNGGFPTILYPALLANILGCFGMGWYKQCAKTLSKRPYWNPAIATGISTGFFGSLTTLSSWILAVSLGLFHLYPLTAAFSLLLTFSSCRSSHQYFIFYQPSAKVDSLFKYIMGYTIGPLIFLWVLWIILCTIVIFFVENFFIKLNAVALIAGPFGALVRWSFSNSFDKDFETIYFGTLLSNIFGTFLISFFFGLNSFLHQSYLVSGLMVGFCGSATTVSSFVSQTFDLKKSERYIVLTFFTCIFVSYFPIIIWNLILG